MKLRDMAIRDGDDEDDNVQHTNLAFLRLDAAGVAPLSHHLLPAARLQAGDLRQENPACPPS